MTYKEQWSYIKEYYLEEYLWWDVGLMVILAYLSLSGGLSSIGFQPDGGAVGWAIMRVIILNIHLRYERRRVIQENADKLASERD